ncbi:MAG: glycosyltransferase family 4 protein, partial [Acidobacteria bacterium]|nr:glycosyltransferase family 4 protein [Acidobacteriota bacterium]
VRLVLTRHHYLPMRRNPVYRRLLNHTSRIIAVSGYVREQLLRSGWEESRIVVIHNWLSPDATPSDRLESRDRGRDEWGFTRPLIVGSAGALTPAKGHEDLIRAAKAVTDSIPNAEFAIAGSDPEPGRPTASRLETLIREFRIEDRFRILPPAQPLRVFLNQLDVFVLPSWNEAFSLVLIEAMAAGLAVIATEVGGPSEIVRHDETGILVPPKNPARISAAVESLLGDASRRLRLGAAARTDVLARFNFDRALDQVEALYREVME